MSLNNGEPSISENFRELLSYVTSLGEHINQVYARLEKIEESISEAKEELLASISDNKDEIEEIKRITITKSEFNDLLQKINEPFDEFSPPTTSQQPLEENSQNEMITLNEDYTQDEED